MACVTRRDMLLGSAAALSLGAEEQGGDRLGLNCFLPSEETAARQTLEQARQAGFRRIQLYFSWVDASEPYLRGLPAWVKAADLEVVALGSYVNCVAPEILIMGTRAKDLDRAIEMAPAFGAQRLVSWTGGYGPKLFTADERNWQPAAADAILRTLEPRYQRLEGQRLKLVLESYITLCCPDAPSLRRLLDRTPPFINAVFDPPNLTPIDEYGRRDEVLRAMPAVLKDRVGIVHWKDFRLAKDGRSYDLPGPMGGVMDVPLFLACVKKLPRETPIVAEHIPPDKYAEFHAKLLPVFTRARGNGQ